ncbi:HAD family hydrolase [uncultured Parabacteroides sp.]|jgi:D-glycero-D-manno-heptose 1,7-bisphosphate phosphatase|uniref:D-glycero-alpha-D-manno-heptose-1,7-bisphosphate 7-phosphatase n=1 Tax=uncultured Parabacteroides sp. TaxID=512312 RepID=UPI0025D35E13|nr:HAD family hydrolase [uncultured Parabacteroides sp.]
MKNTKPYSTLFLDRDGVINKQRPHDYVKSPDEFIFLDGALEALELLSPLFDHIVIVTNQRGVGKGVMSMEALEEIHASMLATVTLHGGRIDKVYACTATSNSHKSRKPNIGMALQAKQDFPDIDFSTSFMAGDSISDMLFAKNAGITGVFIGNKYGPGEISKTLYQAHYSDLLSFSQAFFL